MSGLIYQLYSPNGLVENKPVSNSSRLVLIEAEKYGVSWRIIPGTQIVELTYNGVSKTYYHQVPSNTSALAKYACNNKKTTSNLLQLAGVSVPKGYRIKRESEEKYYKTVYQALKKPLVVKPSNGAHGSNISVGIRTYDDYLKAVENAFEYSGKKQQATIIVEEMFDGTEYRILTTREKVIGVLYRRPASVLGDGIHTIEELIAIKNTQPIRSGKKGTCSHLKIRKDKKLLEYLREQKLEYSTIPSEGERVFLRRVSNISQGGDAIDFTDKVHESVKQIALRAIRAIPDLAFTGVDIISSDITKQQTDETYVVIEINDSPGFDMHDYPYKGKNRHAAREFLFLLFPELRTLKRS